MPQSIKSSISDVVKFLERFSFSVLLKHAILRKHLFVKDFHVLSIDLTFISKLISYFMEYP